MGSLIELNLQVANPVPETEIMPRNNSSPEGARRTYNLKPIEVAEEDISET